ncbi:MAG: hypothetical protein Q9165_008501 [Trypethelium subeluteriae]
MDELRSINPLIMLGLLPMIVIMISWQKLNKPSEPPRLRETIPFVSNTWQFMTNKPLFVNRIREALKSNPIVQCRLGPLKIHFVTGGANVSIIFRSSFTSEPWIHHIQKYAAGYAPSDLKKFAEDKSGGANVARNGNDQVPSPEKRIWHAMHRMNEDGLLTARSVDTFVRPYQVFFDEQLSMSPVGEWVENVHVFAFLRQNMMVPATRSLLGERILDINPDLVGAFWEFEKHGETLAFGLGNWLNRRAILARDRFRDMCLKWYEVADREFDWEGLGTQQDLGWEPIFGSRMSRGHSQWVKSFDFSGQTIGGIFALFFFG